MGNENQIDAQQAVCESIKDRVVLWQDHAHGHGYNPKLEMLTFPDGKMCLQLSVFGRVQRFPYVKAECPRCV